MQHQNALQSLYQITEVELIYRNPVKPADRKRVKTSQEVYDVLLSTWDMNKIELLEDFKILLLDRQNACLGISSVARGGTHECATDTKLIFATALKARASGLILAHNHPSGSLTPSNSDIQLTEKIGEASQLLGLKVLDHIIVTPHGYYSFADEGLIPL